MHAHRPNRAIKAFMTKTSSRRAFLLFRRIASLLALCCAVAASAQSSARVGLTTRTFHPKETRNWRGAQAKELHCTVWYPAAGTAIETRQIIGPPDAPLFEAGSATPHAEFCLLYTSPSPRDRQKS